MSPRHIDHTAPACLAAREVLNRVGDKWSIYIVGYLRDGPLRFNELRRIWSRHKNIPVLARCEQGKEANVWAEHWFDPDSDGTT